MVLNDAGVGKDDAGIGSLAFADGINMPAATVAYDSARIGDAEDMLIRGRISYANAAAAALGVTLGMSCNAATRKLAAAAAHATPETYTEARTIEGSNPQGLRIACIDSVSLVHEDDVGQIVLSGSHGGVVSGQRALAIRVQAAAAFYNDAGVGIDAAGVTRLPVLDEMGVAAATVSSMSARIGDGRSTYHDGIISHCNELATACGMRAGMSARDAVALVPAPTKS
jgi:hypothetical protein